MTALVTSYKMSDRNDSSVEVPVYGLGKLTDLDSFQVAATLDHLHSIRQVTPDGTSGDDNLGIPAIYMEEGEHAGTYRRMDQGLLAELAHAYNQNGNSAWLAEVERHLIRLVGKTPEHTDPDLVFMQNCIFNYRTGERTEFSPDYVTLAKYATDLPEQSPPVPTIENPDGTIWDAEAWLTEVMPDDESRSLLLRTIGAALRPRVDWEKMVIFYSEEGANGKGTVLELIRAIVGPKLVANVPLSTYSEPFGLEQIVGKLLNLVDENDVGAFIKAAANLKSIITNDVVTVNRKHKPAISYRPTLFSIQSMNEWPKLRDKSEAMMRRLLFLNFPKRFVGGAKNTAIRSDYVKRPEVREWFAYQVLVEMPKYYELKEPQTSLDAMKEFRLQTNPVDAYWDEFGDEFERDFLPFPMLYAHFHAWSKSINPNGTVESSNKFTRRLKALLDDNVWFAPQGANGKDLEFSSVQWLVGHEPVLDDFSHVPDVAKWIWDDNACNSAGGLLPFVPRKARGLVRRSAHASHMAANSTPYSASGGRAPRR